jgi:hypothetical protein
MFIEKFTEIRFGKLFFFPTFADYLKQMKRAREYFTPK